MTDLVILAGGKGSRIKKYLGNCCKPMIKFKKFFFLDFILFTYSKYFFKNIFILAGYRGKQIKKEFHNKIYNLSKIKVIIEKKLKGTAGCLRILKNQIDKDFILVNGDTIVDVDINQLKKISKNPFVYGSMSLVKNYNYSQNDLLNNLDIQNNYIVKNNKKTIFMNAGVYFFKKKLLNIIKVGNISLEKDLLPNLIKKKMIKGIYSHSFFLDIGTPRNLIYAKKNIIKNFYKPALFFDRDGVINYDKGYTYRINELKFIRKTLKFLKKNKRKYYFFIVTNQSGIAKKKFNIGNFFLFQRNLLFKLSKLNIFFNDIEFCPHHPQGVIKKYKKKCSCRKPGDQMIRNLLNKWPIIKEKSIFIGDSLTDRIAANKSKIKFIDVKSI